MKVRKEKKIFYLPELSGYQCVAIHGDLKVRKFTSKDFFMLIFIYSKRIENVIWTVSVLGLHQY
jgi:hypothetical protein